MNKPYIFKKVNDHFYLIAEMHNVFPKHEKSNPPHTCTMGLVIGEKKAALIDTGAGIGDLKAFVSQLTDKPIIVLNTHAHMDHIGANSLFDISYFSEKDVGLLKDNSKESRLGFLRSVLDGLPDMITYAEQNIIGDAPFRYEFIEDGDVIDLGGVHLEVLAIPGHSKGSLAFIDKRDNVVFGGDSILFRVLLNVEPDASIHDYVNSLDHLLKVTEGIDTIIPGHQWEPLHRSDVLELRECAMEILGGAEGSPITLLDRAGRIHVHGKKRIVFNEPKKNK